jgi:hypothetical protein
MRLIQLYMVVWRQRLARYCLRAGPILCGFGRTASRLLNEKRPQLLEGKAGAVIPMHQVRGDNDDWRQHQTSQVASRS